MPDDKNMRKMQKKTDLVRADGISPPTSLGDFTTADHTRLEHAAPLHLRVQALQQEDPSAGGESAAQGTLNIPAMWKGDSVTEDVFPATPQAAERKATERKDAFWNMSSDFIYRQHIAPRGQFFNCPMKRRSRYL